MSLEDLNKLQPGKSSIIDYFNVAIFLQLTTQEVHDQCNEEVRKPTNQGSSTYTSMINIMRE